MSYCRWGSDQGRSDVYCYENVSGAWTTHVAGRKPKALETRPPEPPFSLLETDEAEWARQEKALRAWQESCEYESIGLPHDGCSFDDAGPAEMIKTLEMLRAEGYHIPQFALDALAEEVAERNAHASSEQSR